MREEGGHEAVPGAAEGAVRGGIECGGDGAVGRVEGGGVDVDSVAVFESRVGAFPGCDAAAAAPKEEGGVLDPEGSEAVWFFLISDLVPVGRKRWGHSQRKSVCPAMMLLYIHAFPNFPMYTYPLTSAPSPPPLSQSTVV